MAGLLKTWSYSTYNAFQRCPRRVYLEKIQQEPQPALEIPDGKTEHPLDRGSRIHEAAELYVTEDVELIPELIQFAECFKAVRRLQVLEPIDMVVEEEWAFTADWNVTGWHSDDAWLRMKLDLLLIRGSEGCLVDYKSGRRHGNEISHMMQAQLYQLGAFIRYPELTHITTEFWYVDVGEIAQAHFHRGYGMQFLPLFTQKGKEITDEVVFKAKPSPYACKFCPYGKINGNGICAYSYIMRSN